MIDFIRIILQFYFKSTTYREAKTNKLQIKTDDISYFLYFCSSKRVKCIN